MRIDVIGIVSGLFLAAPGVDDSQAIHPTIIIAVNSGKVEFGGGQFGDGVLHHFLGAQIVPRAIIGAIIFVAVVERHPIRHHGFNRQLVAGSFPVIVLHRAVRAIHRVAWGVECGLNVCFGVVAF